MTDIENIEDIKKIIVTFYKKAINDKSLGPIFNKRLSDENWDEHMQTITYFWSDIIFETSLYSGRPFPKHLNLGIKPDHFINWLSLFHESIDELNSGKNADKMHQKAEQIAQVFISKLNILEERQSPNLDLLM